jgi:hypothetical protein
MLTGAIAHRFLRPGAPEADPAQAGKQD